MKQIRILTIDDHPLLRAGISAVIQDEKDMLVVGDASGGRDAIESSTTCGQT
jgi:DNA-binding NarL/FixJ family response regulator